MIPIWISYPVYPICLSPPKSRLPNKPAKKERLSELALKIRHLKNQIFPERPQKVPRKNTLVSDEEIFQYIESHNITKTREFLGVGSYRINRVLSEKKGTKKHKRKTTDEIDEFIVETAASGIYYAEDIAGLIFLKFGLRISHDTVNRRLIENKFNFRLPRHIQMLSSAQIFNRFNFSFNLLNNFSYNLEKIIKKIIFTDECRICGGPDCSKRWFRSDDYSDITTIGTEKFSISVMIFAAIGYDYKSDIYFIDGCLNSDKYINLLIQSGLFKKLDEKFGRFNYLYEQDGAPCHTTQRSINYIEQNARLLYGWPPNSPDLSPIEMLWSIVKHKLQKLDHMPTNKQQLKDAIIEIWKTIEIETVNSLIESFQYRIQMCHDVAGKSISHYLSSNKHSIPEEDRATDFP